MPETSPAAWPRLHGLLRLAGIVALLIATACGSPSPLPTTASLPTPAPTATPATFTALVPMPTATPLAPIAPPNFDLCWVAYAPTEFDPTVGRAPLPSSLREDLALLYAAGFRGLITYGAAGSLNRIPELAKAAGLEQVIMGVANPVDETELQAAIAAAPFVDGYLVGNEGLGDERYTLEVLRQAIDRLRAATGKPTSTSERVDDYYNLPGLLALGDWLAPIVQPYWFNVKDPADAAEWTAQQFADLRAEVGPERVIQFKEVGLPTEGDAAVSEAGQAAYYQALQTTGVPFTYFEAFDQYWKSEGAERTVGPHWGLFRADRAPKPAAGYVCGRVPPTPTASPSATTGPTEPAAVTATPSRPATATPPAPQVVVIYGGTLAEGYALNIDNASHTYGWLTTVDGALRADFLADEDWAAVYFTVGAPQPAGQRGQFKDFSGCQTMPVDLRAAQTGTTAWLGMKDVDDGDGSETLVSVPLTAAWQTFSVPLAQFTTADQQRIYLPFEVVYLDAAAGTVFINNIRFVCQL